MEEDRIRLRWCIKNLKIMINAGVIIRYLKVNRKPEKYRKTAQNKECSLLRVESNRCEAAAEDVAND